MTDAVSLYITCADRAEALNLGRSLVEAQLAACANVIDGVTSVFAWEGEIQESAEALLFAKTRRDLIDAATDLIKIEHSYDCPCIVALPIVGGNKEFTDWIGAATGEDEAVSSL
mgnify:CR=1 FL=1